jgi:DNA polymerase-3 subunit epsilon
LNSIPGGRFVVLDFETTGLSPAMGARVIEVSAREVVDGRAGHEFLTFVDPGVRVPAEITQITGITTAMLNGAPTSVAAMRQLTSFIGSSPIVCHNAGFDRRFYEYEASAFLDGRPVRSFCTLLLARRLFPGRKSYRLGSLIDEMGIASPGRLHWASADTFVTTHLFDRICADARSRCRAEQFDHDVLHRLQRVRIAGAGDWLAALGSPALAARGRAGPLSHEARYHSDPGRNS